MHSQSDNLALLTDLRLALAFKLGLTEDTKINPRKPATPAHGWYLYLSGLQSALLESGFGVGQDPGWGSSPPA